MRTVNINILKEYFKNRDDILMAFVFGSYAKGNQNSESDLDLAVYFYPENNELEWEEEKEYPDEDCIWTDIERISGMNTDLVILNRAPSNLAYSVLQDGVPIIIKNPSFYLRYFLCISSAAEDFRELVYDFIKIKQRSKSLSEIDRLRLLNIIDFLKNELKDYNYFKKIMDEQYESDAYMRRNIERWVENIVNSLIDIAKILLASENKKIPQTYRLVLQDLADLNEFDKETAKELSKNAKMRNVHAHEYMDIRFRQIKNFLKDTDGMYNYLVGFVQENFIDNRDQESAKQE